MGKGMLIKIVIAIVVVLMASAIGTYVLLMSENTSERGMPHIGEIELSFSELPALNKTVNVTLTGKTKGLDWWIGTGGGGFIFFKNESEGFDWVCGKPSSKPYEINESQKYGEIEEPYFVYKNCTVWGESGKMIQLKGAIKVVKTGNWTLAGFFRYDGYSLINYSADHPPLLDTGNRSAKEWWRDEGCFRMFTRIIIHVGLDSSYIVEEERFEPLGHGPPVCYYYYNSTHPEGTSHETPTETPTAPSVISSMGDINNQELPVEENNQQAPLTINLSFHPINISEANISGEVLCQVLSTIDTVVGNCQITFPNGGIEVIDGNTSWSFSLNTNESTNTTLTIDMLGNGNYIVYANASTTNSLTWQLMSICVNGSSWSVSYYPINHTPHTICEIPRDATSEGVGNSTRIIGHLKYYNHRFNDYLPRKRVDVYVYDVDYGAYLPWENGLELIWHGETNINGIFDTGWFSSADDEHGEGGTRDIYMQFYPECSNIVVRGGWDLQYYGETDIFWNVPDTTETFYFDSNWMPFKIYGPAVEGWWFMHVLGYDIPKVKILWEDGHSTDYWGWGSCPSESHYHAGISNLHPDYEIHLNYQELVDTAHTVLHEYGHHMMNMGMGGYPSGAEGTHDYFMELNPNLAWCEGWADFFRYVVYEWVASTHGYPTPSYQEFIEDPDEWNLGGLGIGPDNFYVEWTGQLNIDTSDTYTFYFVADDWVKLYIDDTLLIDTWFESPLKEVTTTTYLGIGNHDVVIEYFECTGDAILKWYWSSSTISKELVPYDHLSYVDVSGTHVGLKGVYTDYTEWSPVFERADPVICFFWGTGRPIPLIGPDTFKVVWDGKVNVPSSGTYTFYIQSPDPDPFFPPYNTIDCNVILSIDGSEVINVGPVVVTENSPIEWSYNGYLSSGMHLLSLTYEEGNGNAGIKLSWSSSSTTKQAIPQSTLYYYDSEMGSYIRGGLKGYYYDGDAYHSYDLKMIRIDPEVYFGWGSDSPIQIWTKNGVVWLGDCYPINDVNELRVATALYDLYDTSYDGLDLCGGGFDSIWNTMGQGGTIKNNFAEFWSAWKTRYSYTKQNHYAKQAIFWNTINYNNAPTSCTITSSFDLNTYYKGTITLSTSVVDSDTEDSSYLQIEFWCNYYDPQMDQYIWRYIGTTSPGSLSLSWDTTTAPVWGYVCVKARASDGMEYSGWSSYVYINIDSSPPSSQVQQISSYWQTSVPFIVAARAVDYLPDRITMGGSGVKDVALYYRYSNDGNTWTTWTLFATNANDEYSWFYYSFTLPNGDGYYEFYSIATDNAGNVEGTPASADANAKFDTNDPITSDNAPSGWQTTKPITVTLTATDATSGVAHTYYKKWLTTSTEPTNWIEGTSIVLDSDGIWNIKYYSVDNAGNSETTTTKQVKIDTTSPTSSVNTISPYWQTASPLTITTTASDTGYSGLASVELWYRYSTDNATWGGWVLSGTDTASPWSWSFAFSNGTGYYEFYTRARDTATNYESAPATRDTLCGYDNTIPTSSANTISPHWRTTSPLTVNATASDTVSGLASVELWYRYSTNNATWSDWTLFSTDTATPWSWTFNFPNGESYYQFYTRARDKATNYEAAPGTADAICGYDYTQPSSYVIPLPTWSKQTFTVSWAGSDLSGIASYDVQYKVGSGSWVNWSSGVADASATFNGEHLKTYYFRCRARDNAGNVEEYPIGDGYDAYTTVDAIVPEAPPLSETHCGTGWTTHNTPYLTWNQTYDNGSGVSYYCIVRNGSLIGTTSNLYYHCSPLESGTYIFNVYAVDYAGNEGTWSNSVTVNIGYYTA